MESSITQPKKEKNKKIYGPEIIQETKNNFIFRKFKREFLYCTENF